jgi:hypothetical protein
VTEAAIAAKNQTKDKLKKQGEKQDKIRKSSNEKGLLDAQPGLAAATTRRNQEDAAVTKVAAAAAEDARLQRERDDSRAATKNYRVDCRWGTTERAIGCREMEVPAV